MGRDAKSVALAKKKAAYVAELVKDDANVTMLTVRNKVIEKFGSSLRFQLARAAFIDAGGRILRKHQPGQGKKKTTALKPTNGRLKASRRKAGRRKADKTVTKAARKIGELQTHLVVISTKGEPLVRSFPNKADATDFITQQLVVGTPLTVVGCYVRQPLAVEFEV